MRIILSTILLAICVIQQVTAAVWTATHHPDSIYVFTYADGPASDGIKLAYSIDQSTWISLGNHSFVKSDFGPWGSYKKMYDPSVLYDNGCWYAVWTLAEGCNQFATTQSPDFWTWKPQDYPYLPNEHQFLHPTLTKENDGFVVCYQSGNGKCYKTTSGDFKSWTPSEEISPENYKKHQTTKGVILSGKQLKGNISRVPYSFIETIKYRLNDSSKRNESYGERTRDDNQRFSGVKSLKGTLHVSNKSKEISPDLIGIFFEDINYSADGGLYAELIQNRDFEYTESDHGGWNAKSFWDLKGEDATWEISTDAPIHSNNSHYASIISKGTNASLVNNGFDGIVLKKNDHYDASLFIKSLDGKKHTVKVSLLSEGKVLASASFRISGRDWKQFQSILIPSADSDKASLSVELQGQGNVGIDFVSLFPQKTFKNRKNGLRADLAQALADLKPRFIRFPGGCVSHGNGLDNMYRWIETIGPLWERKSQPNIWHYHQSKGLGFYEYFQFCEDIGAEPLPVLPAGVCCQNSSVGGFGQQGGLPMEEMDAYTQELMDLIEWANGDPKTSKLAKMRADAGHPAPFNLKMLGVGNEDLISDVFVERFNYIHKKIKSKYPEIKIVGTVGPFFEGSDYEYGWKLAKEEKIDIVDEHYYVDPGWYINSQNYYDTYDREGTKVYLGEWASRGNNLENALAEALHVTNLERNADVVVMSSYAPLLAKEGHTQWNPDLIYFTNTEVHPTVNYYVQKMCGNNSGNRYVYSDMNVKAISEDRNGKSVEREHNAANLRLKSSVVTTTDGAIIIKIVNITPFNTPIKLDIDGEDLDCESTVEVLKGLPSDKNIKPETTSLHISKDTEYTAPAYSFSVIRIKK